MILECEPRLVPLFARSFPGAHGASPPRSAAIGGTAIADYGWLKAAGGANAAILMGSLPRYLRGSLDNFPAPHSFLMPDADEVARWKNVFGDERHRHLLAQRQAGGHRSVQYAPLEAWGAFPARAAAAPIVCVPV